VSVSPFPLVSVLYFSYFFFLFPPASALFSSLPSLFLLQRQLRPLIYIVFCLFLFCCFFSAFQCTFFFISFFHSFKKNKKKGSSKAVVLLFIHFSHRSTYNPADISAVAKCPALNNSHRQSIPYIAPYSTDSALRAIFSDCLPSFLLPAYRHFIWNFPGKFDFTVDLCHYSSLPLANLRSQKREPNINFVFRNG